MRTFSFLIKSFVLSLFLLVISNTTYSQDPIEITLEPRFSLSKSIDDSWEINFQGTTYNTLTERNNEQWTESTYDYSQAQLFAHYKVWPSFKTSLAYRFRLYPSDSDNFNEHRIIQQLTYSPPNIPVRTSHRLRIEERLRKKGSELRLRYRISIDFPLKGLKINVNEQFLDLNNEVLYSYKPGSHDLENRLGLTWGYILTSKSKIATTLQYRLQEIIQSRKTTEFYWNITFYQNF